MKISCLYWLELCKRECSKCSRLRDRPDQIFWWWALTLPPRINEEATSALWLTSNGAPLDCRLSTACSAGEGFAEPGTSKRHNIVMARWIGDDPSLGSSPIVIRHREAPMNPLGARCRNTLPEWGLLHLLRGTTTAFC